jgi:hypothetical protein
MDIQFDIQKLLQGVERHFQPAEPQPKNSVLPESVVKHRDTDRFHIARSTGQLAKDQGNRLSALQYWQRKQSAEADTPSRGAAKFESCAPMGIDEENGNNLGSPGLNVDSMTIANKNRQLIQNYVERKAK